MLLKDNIGDYFGFGDLEEKVVGIEIEMEADTEFPDSKETRYYWIKEHDGSLRGEYNIEYVLRKPMPKKSAMRALDKLALALKQYDTEVVDSVRAGTHVHINVRDLSFLEMWTMVTCWYIVEKLLTHTMCGEGRVGNHFCLGVEEADVVLFEICKVLRGQRMGRLDKDEVRYSALNFVSLFNYGSLEFRAMRTPINFEEIKQWVDILLAIKENSKLFPHPRHVIENFSYGGERNFLRQLLGNENAEMVMRRDPDWERKLKKGVRLAQEIAYTRDNWGKEEERKERELQMYIEIPQRQHLNMEQFAKLFNVEIDNG